MKRMLDTYQAVRHAERLPISVLDELRGAHNVNLHADGDGDEWLDADLPCEITDMMRVLDDDEAFYYLSH